MFSRVDQIQSFPSLKFLQTKKLRFEFQNSILLILNLSYWYISHQILDFFLKSYFKFLNWSNKRPNPTAFQELANLHNKSNDTRPIVWHGSAGDGWLDDI